MVRESKVLRWVLLFPVSVGAAIGAYLCVRAILMIQGFIGGMSESLWLYFVINESSHLVLGYLFVAVGTSMAPAHKAVISIIHFFIISTLFTVLAAWQLFSATLLIDYIDAIGLASVALGAGYNLYQYMDSKFLLFWDDELVS